MVWRICISQLHLREWWGVGCHTISVVDEGLRVEIDIKMIISLFSVQSILPGRLV